MQHSKVILRLSALRTKVRRRLVAYGLCTVFSGGLAAFLAITALDWLLWLPPGLRVAAATLFIGALLAGAFYWIVRPMRARLGIDEIAARLEAYFGRLQDRLLSTVNFIEHGKGGRITPDMGSERMVQHVIATTEQIVTDLPLESALSLRPLAMRGALLAGCTVVFVAALLVSPAWPRTGFLRYFYPWSEIEWPRTVSILPLTGDQTVAVGESATVGMRIERGLSPRLRGVVHFREPDGRTVTLAMQRSVDTLPADDVARSADFHAVIDAVTKDLAYWFEAGDADTSRTPYTIRAVRRPQVVEALVSVEPPPYASGHAVRVQGLRDGPVRAPIGGQVRLTLRASKPVPPEQAGTTPGLRTEGGDLIPLAVNPKDHHELSARLKVTRDVRFRIELRDADGFENRGGGQYSILATPDMPPIVSVLQPQAVMELTPAGSVRLVIRVDDDFGITQLALEVERLGAAGPHRLSLTDRLERVRPREHGQGALPLLGEDGVEAVVQFLWDVASAGVGPLSPGDTVMYTAVATDNRAPPAGPGQVGRSTPMRVKIISDVEFDARLRSDLALLEQRIRRVALDEAGLFDRTTALRQAGDDPQPLTETQRNVAAMLAGQQARMVRRLRDLAGRLFALAERMERNHLGDDEGRTRIASLGGTLQELAVGPTTLASSALGEAHEQVDPGRQQSALTRASGSQETVIGRLHSLLALMSQWGSLRELIGRTRGLLDRQNALRNETRDLAEATLGKLLDSLTEAEEAKLKRARRRQTRLATDVERLLSGIEERAASMMDDDPSGAEAMDAALRAARAHDLTKHMHDAVAGLEANRTAAATIAQERAAEALREILDVLQEKDVFALQELRKRIARAEEQLALLIERQRALRQATREAAMMGAGEDTSASLAQEQRRLRRDCELLGEELAETGRRSAPVTKKETAVRLIRRAAAPMAQAVQHLLENHPQPAATEQDEALTLLNEALRRLEELARQAEDELLRRSLAQIREDIGRMLEAQRRINTGIAELMGMIERRGRISRRESRAASKLARAQADVRLMVDRSLRDFEQVVVYKWAFQRIATWMDKSREQLTSRRIDDRLAATTTRIVRELEKLLEAVVQTQALPVDSSFVESDGGGRSAGASVYNKPVPTVAELLVLKAMQVDINERTAQLDQSLDVKEAAEEQLRELAVLGEDQTDVMRLTEMVTRRVRRP